MDKFRGFPVVKQTKRVILVYSQYDMGDKWKIYARSEGVFVFVISFNTISESFRYFAKMTESERK